MTDLTETLARDLETARQRTLLLTDHDEPELLRQHTPLLSPLVWDLAHIGQQEDLWLLRHGDGRRAGLLPEVLALTDLVDRGLGPGDALLTAARAGGPRAALLGAAGVPA